MEGFFVILIFIIAAFSILFGKDAGAKLSAGRKSEADNIPASLRAKWDAEDETTSGQSEQVTSHHALNPQARRPGLERDERELNEETERQTRRDDHRTKAQRKAMAKLGRGEPRDQNPNRRDDWGRRGHLSGGWVTPAIISLLSAGAVAALFASS
ncbi:hypothetical protein [Litorimonas haliclonae]|uniref:hypothetical protein n=1 Tax=Litorimonas haliclonae TaxID=2081977 RepID=UPI0039F0C81F